jgi:hypothetical protein
LSFAKEALDRVSQDRFAKVEALSELGTEVAQAGELFRVLDALGHGHEPEAVGESDDRLGDLA